MNGENFGEKRTPISEIPQDDVERIQTLVDEYAESHSGFTEVAHEDIDTIVSRLIEKGQELEPNVRDSLSKAVKFMLGAKIMEREK